MVLETNSAQAPGRPRFKPNSTTYCRPGFTAHSLSFLTQKVAKTPTLLSCWEG